MQTRMSNPLIEFTQALEAAESRYNVECWLAEMPADRIKFLALCLAEVQKVIYARPTKGSSK